MYRSTAVFLMVLLTFCIPASWAEETPTQLPEVPVKGMVTLLDLGADKCVPCRMMAPIIEDLKKEYNGRAAIIFIDVWKNEGQSGKYKVRVIPTQIFYDKEGKEVYRHEGFLDRKSITGMFEKLGVK